MKSRIEVIRSKTLECLATAKAIYGTDINLDIRFDLTGTCAGQAILKAGKYTIRYNINLINGEGFNHILNDTVPHEVAHLVNFADRSTGKGHDKRWRAVCIALGGAGATRHNEEVFYSRGKTYQYTCTAGRNVNMSENRHRKIQDGARYTITGGGEINKHCKCIVVGSQGVAINTNKPATKKAISTKTYSGKKSKIDHVRSWLVSGYSVEEIMQMASEVGITPTMTKRYVSHIKAS